MENRAAPVAPRAEEMRAVNVLVRGRRVPWEVAPESARDYPAGRFGCARQAPSHDVVHDGFWPVAPHDGPKLG
jgi:hypothetical protein